MQKHLDGSKCKSRISMPKKSQIAYYWKDKTYDYFNYLIYWGEPSCWACGKWDEHCPDLENSDATINETFDFWNKHKYLERCHIIPKAHNGCNCEANLVLMCKECHKASPDTLNPIIFQTWVKNRASWIKISHQKLEQVFNDLNFQSEDNDYKIMLSKEFKSFVLKNAIPVQGKFALSTMIACLIEFKQKVSKSELQQIYKEHEKNKLFK